MTDVPESVRTNPKVIKARKRYVIFRTAFEIILTIAVALTGSAAIVLYIRQESECRFYHDLGNIDLSKSPDSSTTAFQIVADARNTFHSLGCSGGFSRPADTRIIPYLHN